MKRTALYESHVALGAKIIEFGGWDMPVNYPSGILKEHVNTRQNAGLFDISHMGEILVQGDNATTFLQYVMTNDLNLMEDGKGQYANMCYPHGGSIDDCFYYRYSVEKYRIIVNASNLEKDYAWLTEQAPQFGVELENLSNQRGRLSLQGPRAEDILSKLTDADIANLNRFYFLEGQVQGVDAFIARTGYTGETGFEVSFPIEESTGIWQTIMDAGAEYSILPVGLGARDTLRLEACYSLYGHELNADISPVEAGIGWCVKPKEAPFIGMEVLMAQKEHGTTRTIKPIEVVGKEIVRGWQEIFTDHYKVGYVTSGTYSPSLKKGIGLAMISVDFANPGTELEVDVRGKHVKVVVRDAPFIKYGG